MCKLAMRSIDRFRVIETCAILGYEGRRSGVSTRFEASSMVGLIMLGDDTSTSLLDFWEKLGLGRVDGDWIRWD